MNIFFLRKIILGITIYCGIESIIRIIAALRGQYPRLEFFNGIARIAICVALNLIVM